MNQNILNSNMSFDLNPLSTKEAIHGHEAATHHQADADQGQVQHMQRLSPDWTFQFPLS